MDFNAIFSLFSDGGPFVWGLMIGFAIGWQIFPQPEWTKPYTDKVKALLGMVTKKPDDTPPTKPTSNTA